MVGLLDKQHNFTNHYDGLTRTNTIYENIEREVFAGVKKGEGTHT
jgi:hypothetical protein